MVPRPDLPPRSDDAWTLKAAVQRFEHAWRQRLRPAIDDFLPADAAGRLRA